MPLLDWLNKADAVSAAQKVPYRLFEALPELSAGDTNNGNMLIQGDNLQALKALLPLYAGKVKCIYIDPPYNTRSAFTHYDDNLEHSLWLSMIYPQLGAVAGTAGRRWQYLGIHRRQRSSLFKGDNGRSVWTREFCGI